MDLRLCLREEIAHGIFGGRECVGEIVVGKFANGAGDFLALPLESLEEYDEGGGVRWCGGEGVAGRNEYVVGPCGLHAVVDGVGGVDGDVGHGHFAEDDANEVVIFPVFEKGDVFFFGGAVVAVGIGGDENCLEVKKMLWRVICGAR